MPYIYGSHYRFENILLLIYWYTFAISWQLNTGQTSGPAGLDLNVEPAWIQGVTGQGVVVSFIDDG